MAPRAPSHAKITRNRSRRPSPFSLDPRHERRRLVLNHHFLFPGTVVMSTLRSTEGLPGALPTPPQQARTSARCNPHVPLGWPASRAASAAPLMRCVCARARAPFAPLTRRTAAHLSLHRVAGVRPKVVIFGFRARQGRCRKAGWRWARPASSPGRWAAEEGAQERRLRAPGGQEGREEPDARGPRWVRFLIFYFFLIDCVCSCWLCVNYVSVCMFQALVSSPF